MILMSITFLISSLSLQYTRCNFKTSQKCGWHNLTVFMQRGFEYKFYVTFLATNKVCFHMWYINKFMFLKGRRR